MRTDRIKMKSTLLLLLFILFAGASEGASNLISTTLPNQQQLPSGQVSLLFQDSEGYMWYGTDGGGLCRDDGYRVKVFRADINTPDLIESNSITCITEDRNRNILFGTRRGAYLLNKTDYSVKPFPDERIAGWDITSINTDSTGNIWISAANSLFRYNSRLEPSGTYSLSWFGFSKYVRNAYVDRQNQLWLTLWRGGMLRFDATADALEEIEWPFEFLPSYIVQDPVHDYYWLGTWGAGLMRYHPDEQDPQRRFILLLASTHLIPTEQRKIEAITFDSRHNRLWVISKEDLHCYQIKADSSLQAISTADFLTPGKKMLNDLLTDRHGHIWVAGYYPHSFIISYLTREIQHDPISVISNSLGFPPAIMNLQSEDQHFWLWQRANGLYVYEPGSENLLHSSNRRLLPNFIKARQSKGIYCVMSDPQLIHIQYLNGRIEEQLLASVPVETGERIRTLHDDGIGSIWIGTSFNLYSYNLETKQINKQWSNTGFINEIMSTSDGTVYIATEAQGILCLQPDGRRLRYAIAENFMHFSLSPDQQLWAGTQQGSLYQIDHPNQRLYNRSRTSGMRGDIITDLAVDCNRQLWIATDQKLTIYNPVEQTFQLMRSNDAGIKLSNFLNLQSGVDGKIYIGGTGGIMSTRPATPQLQPSGTSRVGLTAMRINGVSRLPGYGQQRIVLKAHERNLELLFSSFDPLNRDKIRMAFRYKDSQTRWNHLAEGQNSIFLSELGKGNYQLEVKVTDPHGAWSNHILTLEIERLPAWWESRWALALYILLGAALLYFLLQQYLQSQKSKQLVLMEKQVAEMKYQFFTNISHELRTPLTLVITPLQSIIRQLQEGAVRTQLESVSRHAHQLLNLVNQLLDFRKMEAGGETLQLIPGEMLGFLNRILNSFRESAQSKGIVLEFMSDLTECRVLADYDKLEKMVNNLLSNALKFTAQGGKISLQLDTDTSEKTVLISVSDTGIGIPESELSHIFERFHQIGNTAGGSGIGLHLVDSYARLHKGRVTVSSREGEGSTFTIHLPLLTESDAVVATEAVLATEAINVTEQAKYIVQPTSNLHPADFSKKILIVEDNEEFRQYMKQELGQYYTIHEAADGIEGEKAAIAHQPDIILSDLKMPHRDGIALCRRLKQNIRVSHIPFILLTANSDVASEKEGYREGADAYIAKPFDMETLLYRVQHLMQQQQQRQDDFRQTLEVNPRSITISSVDEQFIQKALNHIEKHMSNANYSIEELSSDMAMSRVNLYRKLVSITGLSPAEFVKSIRLKRAAQLLREGQLTVQETAYRVGFNNPGYFSKAYKKMFGILPSEVGSEKA